MRIVIDMQGAQTGSRYRGIGRYTLSLVKEMLQISSGYEFLLLFNGAYEDGLDSLKAEFRYLLPETSLKVWYSNKGTCFCDNSNLWRRDVAELVREHFIKKLNPDLVFLTSVVEGYGEDFTISISRIDFSVPVVSILYDLIPLENPDYYLPNDNIKEWYFNSLEVLKKSNKLFSISEFSRAEGLRHLYFQEEDIINIDCATNDFFEKKVIEPFRISSLRKKYGIFKEVILCVGATDPRKNHARLIEAYSKLPSEIRKNHQLVVAGGLPQEHMREFRKKAEQFGLLENELVITDRISDEELVIFYNTSKVFVFPSWHEGFGLPALEAIKCGLPTIGSETSSIPEVIGVRDALFNPFDVNSIMDKLKEVLLDESLRNKIIKQQLIYTERFSWHSSATKVIDCFNSLLLSKLPTTINYCRRGGISNQLIEDISLSKNTSDLSGLVDLAQNIAVNEQQYEKRQLFLDVSQLIKSGFITGIQRVVFSIIKFLYEKNNLDLEVQLVYAKQFFGHGKSDYKYIVVNDYEDIGFEGMSCSDELLSFNKDDIFLGLDLIPPLLLEQNLSTIQAMHSLGVKVIFVVYDLMPINLSNYYPDEASNGHKKWLEMASKFDGVVCISKTVADEYQAWLLAQNIKTKKSFSVDWFHLGADIEASHSTKGLPANAKQLIDNFKHIPSFLIVGTLEPRKGHVQTLQAFERLWANGVDVNLVLVGKQGWMVENLITKINAHPELNKRLFWLEGISDEFLEQIYSVSTCLIAASEGEGFGLPLIEAAQKKLPIIARDIPVFKEVAGEHAFYFENSLNPDVIATTIQDWLELYKNNQYPKSDTMPWLTWEESTEQLLKCLNISKKENK